MPPPDECRRAVDTPALLARRADPHHITVTVFCGAEEPNYGVRQNLPRIAWIIVIIHDLRPHIYRGLIISCANGFVHSVMSTCYRSSTIRRAASMRRMSSRLR
jgi:hypothetical protein